MKMSEKPKPGTVFFGPPCKHGYRRFERVLDNGDIQRGTAAPVTEGMAPGAYAVVQTERVNEGDSSVQRVVSETRFTMRGPSSVSSNAYRSGWDAVFSRSQVRPN